MGAVLKIVFGHNSAADCPISVKVCLEKQFFFQRMSVMEHIPAFHRTYSLMFVVWLSVIVKLIVVVVVVVTLLLP